MGFVGLNVRLRDIEINARTELNMKILVTGANGQIGSEIIKLYHHSLHTVRGISSMDFDIRNETAVNNYMDKFKPDAIIHCAAYTFVEKAEMQSNICYDVNVLGTKYLVGCCLKHNAKFLFLSSDYVFDGRLNRPYEVDDAPNPINVYGKSKLQGELIIEEKLSKYFIVRTSWVYGNGKNFIRSMLQLSKGNSVVRVVNDQVGSPTYAFDLAHLIITMIESEKYGTYHATNDGFCSWYEYACEIFKAKKIAVNVVPISSDNYSSKVKRPLNSRLSKIKLSEAGFNQLPSWKKSMVSFLEKI